MNNKTTKMNIGSIWRKWDLHTHSPQTFLHNNFNSCSLDEFVTKFTESEISVVGLTNYFRFEGREIEEIKTKLNEKGIIVFPNIELRTQPQNKDSEEMHIHIIFSDRVPILKITNFLGRLKTVDDKYCKDLTESEIKTTSISFNILLETLKDDNDIKHFEDYLLAACPRGQGSFRPIKDDDGRGNNLAIVIDKTTDILFGSEDDREFFLNKNRYSNARSKPVLSCSDSHELNEIGSKFTWIKAEPTFEGLKQIVYEPETRVFIGEEKPKKPINTVNSISLRIPNEAKVGKDKFCFADKDQSYDLSPYFNCFIGGRGSGKSTILNFLGLHSKNPDSSKIFWFGDGKHNNGLSPNGFDPNDNNIFAFQGTELFEFLAQSEIETFAKDKVKFTQAIYDRANGPSKILQKFEDSNLRYQKDLDQIVTAIFDLQNLLEYKKTKEKEKRSLEITKNIIESKDYEKLTDSISTLTQKLEVHNKWSNEVYLLRTQLNDTIEIYSKFLKNNKDQIKYKDSYLSAINKVKEAIEILEENNFSDSKIEEKALQDNLLLLEGEFKELLKKGNFSEDDIEQIKSAPQKIVELEREIEQIGFQIDGKNEIIATLSNTVTKLKIDKQNYEDKIKEIVMPLQELLKKQFEDNKGKDIKQISLEYSFDENRAWITLANKFYEDIQGKFKNSERSKDVCDFIVSNNQTFSKDAFDEIKRIIKESQKNNKKYIQFLDEVFKDEKNFLIFKAIRDKHLYDVKANKIIQVKYDNKEVEHASFGQRCTAVVVILLLFGNYPLIIDEPETHLDSSLIANYLVPLLKKKKSDRQIIFATHNANFVINGDAEKIFILKNETGQTEVVETTIEDTKNRRELLKLEGGKEAFEKRGKKLNII